MSHVSESDQLIMLATCQITFNKATKVERVLLEEEYPIGNHVQFSDKRVYRDTKTGFYFELNASHLGVWSAAMVCLSIHCHILNDYYLTHAKAQKRTDEKTPPMDSRFFDAGQRLKNIACAPLPPPAPQPIPVAPSALPAAAAAATALTAGLSVSDILIASLLSQSGGLGGLFPNLPTASAPSLQGPSTCPGSPPLSHSAPRTPPLSPIRRHSITIEKFCGLYNIDDVDCEQLKDVGFQPGDGTEPKADEDLKEAGFTIFGWKRVHQANLRFKADLPAGVFDAGLDMYTVA
jgi:hypothetical protein